MHAKGRLDMGSPGQRLLIWLQAPLLRLSLHRRIAVFVSATLLAVFVAFGYLGWESINRSTTATLQERESTSRVVAKHLDDLLGHALAHLIVVAGELPGSGADLDRGRAQAALDGSLPQLRFFFLHLVAIDAQGQIVASTPAGGRFQPDADVATLLDQARRSGRPVVSNIVRLPSQSAPGILLVAPILRAGTPIGVLAGEIGLSNPIFSAIGSALELGRTGHLEVIDGRGLVLASTDEHDVAKTSEHRAFYEPLLASRTSTVGRAIYEDGSEERHIMAFVPLRNAPWGVGLGQDEHETFAATRDLRDRALAVAALALAFALLSAWIGTQSVVQPIETLTEAGERMATGDLSTPIDLDQSDEVGRLARILESMRKRLGHSLDEIRGWNHELEERVTERTRDLETANRHLRALMTVARVANQSNDGSEVIESAVREVTETLPVLGAWATLWDSNGAATSLAADAGAMLSAEGAEPRLVADVECLNGRGVSLQACHFSQHCRALPADAGAKFLGGRCWSAPISVGQQSFGVFCLVTPADRDLSPEEIALVDGLTHQVAVAFENARLIDERTRLAASHRLDLLRGEFLASISHELRTPLGIMKGYATTLLRSDVSWAPEDQREFLQVIDEEADRLAGMVNTLLDAARIHSNRLTLAHAPVRADELVSKVVDRMRSTLESHPIAIMGADAVTFEADSARLEQVLANLIQNAAKYSKPGDGIAVRARAQDDSIRFEVEDRGPGIPDADLDRIFEPFYRVPGATTSSVSGTGLGLAICRSIVEAHGGHIWAEAPAAGGARFVFTIPVRRSEPGGEQR